jgi:hypothetical protein
MKTITRDSKCHYKGSPKFEEQFTEITDFIVKQKPPQNLVEQGIFLETLFTFLVSKLDRKELDQDYFILSIVDLLRRGSCIINETQFEIEQNYLETEDFYFNWEWKDFVEPMLYLCEKEMFYQAFLLLSMYSNLAVPYGAAYGMDGSHEDGKISFLEYLITINSPDPIKLKSELKKMYIPKSTPHFELEDAAMRQVGVSESAEIIYKLKNDLITDFNPLCLQHFVYGIILGKIGTEQVNKYLSKSNKFKSEDVDSIIWDIDILMQGDNEEYRQNDLILADLVNSNYENLASFIVSSSADTLIEFLVQLIKLVPDLDYSELHTILETFILSSNEPDSRTRYINYLIELGGEFKEHSQIENQNGAKKKGFLSKFLGR